MYQVSVSLYLVDYLTAHQLKILLYMKTLVKPRGNSCSVSKKEMARILRMSNKTVASALKFLEERKIIKKQYKERRFIQPDGTYTYQCPQYTIHDFEFSQKINIVGFSRDFVQIKGREENKNTRK